MRISPTAIEKMSFDFGNNEFYIKRDDLIPFSFGGNKVRKALKFFEWILANGYTAVATYGSSSSNHCRIVANMASKFKLPCYIVSPEEGYYQTANSRMVTMFGAEIVKAPLDKIKETINVLMKNISTTHNPFFIQGGGHGNLGTQAYVEAYGEICNYENNNNIKFDYIFHASGTGATQAGLICGAALSNDFVTNIVGISIARANPYGMSVIEESVADYLKSVSYGGKIPKVVFDDSYICGGYGKYTSEIVNMIIAVLENDGIPLDTTYTGKAFWGMKDYILKHGISNKRILFIHTGGTPLFFDELKGFV